MTLDDTIVEAVAATLCAAAMMHTMAEIQRRLRR